MNPPSKRLKKYVWLIPFSGVFILLCSKINIMGIEPHEEHGSDETFKDHFFEHDYEYNLSNLSVEHNIAHSGSNRHDLDQRKSYGNGNDNKTIGGKLRPNDVVYGLLHFAKTGEIKWL